MANHHQISTLDLFSRSRKSWICLSSSWISNTEVFRHYLLSQIFTYYKTYLEPQNTVMSVYSPFMKLYDQLRLKFYQAGNLKTRHCNNFKNFWENLFLQRRLSSFMDFFVEKYFSKSTWNLSVERIKMFVACLFREI